MVSEKVNEIRCRKCDALLGILKNIPVDHYEEFKCHNGPPGKIVSWTDDIKFVSPVKCICERCGSRYIIQHNETGCLVLCLMK